jgi:L-arabinose isomerase
MHIKIGLLGIGLETYWPQFDGLLEKLTGYQQQIADRISKPDVEVVNAGMVDSPQKAMQAAEMLQAASPEIIFVYISTYALSSTVLPVVRNTTAHIVLLNLQPVAQLDYAAFNALQDRGTMTGIWLEHCQACSVPEIASVLNRAGIDYDIVTGHMQDDTAWTAIHAWVAAAKVRKSLRYNRMGVLGHYYGGMLDVYADLTRHSAVFGTHFEMLEMCELKKIRDAVTPSAIKAKMDVFQEAFDVDPDCSVAELQRAAQTSVALDNLAFAHQLGSLAYYYEGEQGNEYQHIVTSVIAGNTLLTGNGIPVAGECEIKNAHAMKIMAALGAGGSFSEFYLIDFQDEVVYLGHDGPAHFAIAEGRVKLVPLPVYHGKPGKGLSIQMTVKHGPATLLSVAEGKDGIFLLVAEGESVPGPVLQIGNTNSRYKFPLPVKDFINQWSVQGPSHHCAIGTGHVADAISKLGRLLKIPVVTITGS